MKVLLVRPNEYAVEADIENGLKPLQNAVGGSIEVFRPNSDPVVYIMNEAGKVLGLRDNRAMYDQRGKIIDVIMGTFLVCGVKGEEFTSLTTKMMKK